VHGEGGRLGRGTSTRTLPRRRRGCGEDNHPVGNPKRKGWWAQ
jgi:hypothetical protein